MKQPALTVRPGSLLKASHRPAAVIAPLQLFAKQLQRSQGLVRPLKSR